MAPVVYGPFAYALHFLSPVGESIENEDLLDSSLLDFLNVTICEFRNRSCLRTVQFTSAAATAGTGPLIIRNHHYEALWYVKKNNTRAVYRIAVSAGGLDVGSVNFTPGSSRTVPVKFQVEPVPRIRARVMRLQGFTAMKIAAALHDEFHTSALEAADILADEHYSSLKVGEAVLVTYSMNAREGAIFLKRIGYSARECYDVLMLVFDIQDEVAIEKILSEAGYGYAEFIDFTARGSVRKFAPVLKFDGSHKGLPMSAQDYFRNMLTLSANSQKKEITWTVPWNGPSPCNINGRSSQCSRDECNCGMQNNNFSRLTAGEIPTYYMAVSDLETTGEGRLRVAYWWFYGFQPPCSYVDGAPGADGSHHGDWEKVIVTTNPERTRADFVTFEFHGQWYTRNYGGFERVGERPAVYVGKLGHGNYHSNQISGWMAGTPSHCCEYADFRNPKSTSVWYNTTAKLVSLRSNAEPWMPADRIGSTYRYNGTSYAITNWRWGPHISYCDWWLFGCMDWVHTSSCGTHPTMYNLGWNLRSCSGGAGCGTCCCRGLVYTHRAYYNQGWPWDT